MIIWHLETIVGKTELTELLVNIATMLLFGSSINFNNLFNEEINSALKGAILDMGKKIKGFDCYDAVLTGVESRTSSPVRVIRGDNYASVSAENLYPCGEGCGYAGGITSAGADGKKVAEAIALKHGIPI